MQILNSSSDISTRYGAVIRSGNAYVPPGARRAPFSPAGPNAVLKADIPRVAINAPDGAPVVVETPTAAKGSPASKVSLANDKIMDTN